MCFLLKDTCRVFLTLAWRRLVMLIIMVVLRNVTATCPAPPCHVWLSNSGQQIADNLYNMLARSGICAASEVQCG
jgi:hypothetical protein